MNEAQRAKVEEQALRKVSDALGYAPSPVNSPKMLNVLDVLNKIQTLIADTMKVLDEMRAETEEVRRRLSLIQQSIGDK